MCAVSVVFDYARSNVPITSWTRDSFSDFQEIIRRLDNLDKKLNQPDCEDPLKAGLLQEIEARLSALEKK